MGFNKQPVNSFVNHLYNSLKEDIKGICSQDKEIRFISDIAYLQNNGKCSIQEKNNKTGTTNLCEITIIDIPKSGDFYFFDRWDETATQILKNAGLKNTCKGVDGIIFYFDNSNLQLDVYLIEMKTTLDDKKIQECVEKFEQTINRLSLFVPIIIYNKNINPKNYKIRFKSIIFFNNKGSVKSISDLSPTELSFTDIYKAYHNIKQNSLGKGTVMIRLNKSLFTLQEYEKIDVRFICYEKNSSIIESSSNLNSIIIKFNNMIF